MKGVVYIKFVAITALLFVAVLFVGPVGIKAADYIVCGSGEGRWDWCGPEGDKAYRAMRCPEGSTFVDSPSIVAQNYYCIENQYISRIALGTLKAYVCKSGVPIANVKPGSGGDTGLCCPSGWRPVDGDLSTDVQCAQSIDLGGAVCEKQKDCNNYESDLVEKEYDTIMWTETRKYCKSNQCFKSRVLAINVCFESYMWVKKKPDGAPSSSDGYWTCVDGEWKVGKIDDPNPGSDGDSDSPSEVPTLTCAQMCAGEAESIEYDDKGNVSSLVPGSNWDYCISCICEGDKDSTTTTGNVWTELGCIDATQNGIIISVMRIFVGVVTGLAIVRFIQAGFMLNTDDPEKIKEGKSIVVSAVAAIAFGALLIVIMNFIGINVLGIGKIIS